MWTPPLRVWGRDVSDGFGGSREGLPHAFASPLMRQRRVIACRGYVSRVVRCDAVCSGFTGSGLSCVTRVLSLVKSGCQSLRQIVTLHVCSDCLLCRIRLFRSLVVHGRRHRRMIGVSRCCPRCPPYGWGGGGQEGLASSAYICAGFLGANPFLVWINLKKRDPSAGCEVARGASSICGNRQTVPVQCLLYVCFSNTPVATSATDMRQVFVFIE